MCEYHDSNGNGFVDTGWADKYIYFSSIDGNVGLLDKVVTP